MDPPKSGHEHLGWTISGVDIVEVLLDLAAASVFKCPHWTLEHHFLTVKYDGHLLLDVCSIHSRISFGFLIDTCHSMSAVYILGYPLDFWWTIVTRCLQHTLHDILWILDGSLWLDVYSVHSRISLDLSSAGTGTSWRPGVQHLKILHLSLARFCH